MIISPCIRCLALLARLEEEPAKELPEAVDGEWTLSPLPLVTSGGGGEASSSATLECASLDNGPLDPSGSSAILLSLTLLLLLRTTMVPVLLRPLVLLLRATTVTLPSLLLLWAVLPEMLLDVWKPRHRGEGESRGGDAIEGTNKRGDPKAEGSPIGVGAGGGGASGEMKLPIMILPSCCGGLRFSVSSEKDPAAGGDLEVMLRLKSRSEVVEALMSAKALMQSKHSFMVGRSCGSVSRQSRIRCTMSMGHSLGASRS